MEPFSPCAFRDRELFCHAIASEKWAILPCEHSCALPGVLGHQEDVPCSSFAQHGLMQFHFLFQCPALSPLLPKAGAGGMKLGGCCLEGPRIRWWLNYPGVHSEI